MSYDPYNPEPTPPLGCLFTVVSVLLAIAAIKGYIWIHYIIKFW